MDASTDDFEEASIDMVLTTLEVHPGGGITLNLEDSCGEHLPDSYWTAAYFDAASTVEKITVEF